MRRLVFLIGFLVVLAAGFLWLTSMEHLNGTSKAGGILLGGGPTVSKSILAPSSPPKPNPLLFGGANDQLRAISTRYQALSGDVIPSIVSIQSYPAQISKSQESNHALLDEFAAYGLEPCFNGGGFFIDTEGTILTSFQVLLGSYSWQVQTSDGEVYPAEPVGIDPATDLALIRIPRKQTQPVRWADDGSLGFGQPVLLVGANADEGPRVLSALVSSGLQNSAGPQGSFYGEYYLLDRSRPDAQPGWLVMNYESGVAGMVAQADHMGTAYSNKCAVIPSAILRPVSELLKQDAVLHRAFLGVSVQELTPLLARSLNLKAGEGVLVAAVVPGSPAQEAGLQPGDLIRSFGDIPVHGRFELRKLAAHMAVGVRVPLAVERKGQKIQLIAVLREHPGCLDDLADEWLEQYREISAFGASHGLLESVTVADTPHSSSAAANAPAGLVVAGVDTASIFCSSPIDAGDFVLEVNGIPVPDKKTYDSLVEQTKNAESLVLRLESADGVRYVVLTHRQNSGAGR